MRERDQEAVALPRGQKQLTSGAAGGVPRSNTRRLNPIEREKQRVKDFLETDQIMENRKKLAELMRIAEIESGTLR